MVLGALTSLLKLESSEDFSPTCLAPCWDGRLASLFHATSPNKYPELPHGMAVSEYSDFLHGVSVPIHRKWRLHSLEAFAQNTDTESLLPYFTWQSSHQTHPNSKGRRYRPYFSTGELKPALTHYTQIVLHGLHHKQRADGRVSSSGSDFCTCEYPHPQVITILLLGNKKRYWWITRVSYLQCFHFTADLQGWASY